MDTNKYLALKNSPKSYLRGGRITRDIDEYLVLNNYPKVLPTEWMDDHRYRRVLGPQKIILNPVGRTGKMKY